MFNTLVSLNHECERLGLSDEARIIKAWISAKLPHMMEETQFVKELYDLYVKVSRLPPNEELQEDFQFRKLNYSTRGKLVRKVMGEIGYLIHAVYKEGFLRHNMYDLSSRIKQNHMDFGLILQTLVGLFGVYYNSSNKEEIIEEELNQMTSLFNTSITSLLGKLQQELAHVKGSAFEMFKGGNIIQQHFIDENDDLVEMANHFFDNINSLMMRIRETFYHTRSKISDEQLRDVREILEELYSFYRDLYDLDSHLDLEGKAYSPKALMYWSVVFSKEKKAKTSYIRERQNISEQIQNKELLSPYSIGIETASEVYSQIVREIRNGLRELIETINVLKNWNNKVYEALTTVISKRVIAESTLEALNVLITNIEKVKTEDIPEEEKVQKVITEFSVESGLISIVKRDISSLASKIDSLIGIKPNFNKDQLLKRDYNDIKRRLEQFVEAIKEQEKPGYEMWLGEIDTSKITEFYTHVYQVITALTEKARNPMRLETQDEELLADLFSFGQPFDQEGQITSGFTHVADVLKEVPYYTEQNITDQEITKDLTNKISNFNKIVNALLVDDPIPLEHSDVTELEKFISKTNEHWKAKELEVQETMEPSPTERTFAVSLRALVGYPVELSELKTEIFNPIKISFKGLEDRVRNIESLYIKSSTNNRLKFASSTTSLQVPFTIEKEGNPPANGMLLFIPKDGRIEVKQLIEENGQTRKIGEEDVLKIRDPSLIQDTINDYLQGYKARENVTYLLRREDRNIQLTKWVDTNFPEDTMEDVEIEALERQELLMDRLKRVYREKAGTPREEKDEKSKKQTVKRLPTIRKNLIDLQTDLPIGKGSRETLAHIKQNTSELERYGQTLFQNLSHFVEQIKEKVQDTEEIGPEETLPLFPKIVYQVYNRAHEAGIGWKSWKTTKIELVINELEMLIRNLEEKERIEERIKAGIEISLKGLPSATIDMIDSKFKDLHELVGA